MFVADVLIQIGLETVTYMQAGSTKAKMCVHGRGWHM